MGTRGFIGFVVDGTEKIAYNHFDSYPSGRGLDILNWLHGTNVDEAAGLARALRVVEPNSTPTADDIERLHPFADLGVGEQTVEDWYVLLRRTQGRPDLILEAGVIEDASDFPTDSLFAEWGYLVDFDARTFEVYQGFQDSAHDKGRFAGRPGTRGYYPVALAASWPLDALPTKDEFMSTVDPDDEDES